MRRLLIAVWIGWSCLQNPSNGQAQQEVLHADMTHLRSGPHREWSDFPEESAGSSLRIDFQADANSAPQTLGLRRIDVKEGWKVSLNDQVLGELFSDENDMREVWELAPNALRDGMNELRIEATGERPDDIYIGQIWLDPRPRDACFSEATLQLTALDPDGQPMPCRFTILDDQGSLAALGAESNDQLAVRSGVVYSATGECRLGLAAGHYTILCGRGFEYDLPKFEVTLDAGSTHAHEFALRRVVDTSGLVACDTHVHTFEISRHGDATLDERMITLVGEGIELAVATDHNIFIDYTPYLERLGLSQYVSTMIGSEVTTKYGHFNVFPARPDADHPNHNAASWDELFDSIYATPDVRIAILNHPRNVHSGFMPFGPEHMLAAVGERLDGRTLRANAIELINSAALQTDPMRVFHAWQTLINRGAHLVAVGSSDSHEVSRKIVGQGRTYIEVDDSQPGAIDLQTATDAIVEGRVLVSLGLLTELVVDGRARSGATFRPEAEELAIDVRVQGPAWVQADRVELYANGQRVRSLEIPDAQREASGIKAQVRWTLEKPTYDVHLVALATGPDIGGLHWPIAKAYQPTSPDWSGYVWGSSGIVRIDADGDGKWTPAQQYASQAVAAAGDDFAELLASLANYDMPVATFAAHEWDQVRGTQLNRELLKSAQDFIQAGFEAYAQSRRESLQAR